MDPFEQLIIINSFRLTAGVNILPLLDNTFYFILLRSLRLEKFCELLLLLGEL